ncbi:MAG: TonB-dependent receptor [Siphonobacter sp.]
MWSLKLANSSLLLLLSYGVQAQLLSGTIREAGSGESIPGATVYIPELNIGTTANTYGYYAIQLGGRQRVTVVFSAVGYEKVRLSAAGNNQLNVSLRPLAQQLQEVQVKEESLALPAMSQVQIPLQQIKNLPVMLGEKDVIKAIQFLPGVQKGMEGSTALYVRGGGPDQNLILLDEAPVYNANHLFGFFSVFNGDALKSVNFWKGGFPARYGGRISSVIDLQMKEGSREKFHGEGGIGLLASRLTLEGPIKKGKSSFLLSGRRTYFDAFTVPFTKREDSYFHYYFYDLNAKLNFDLGPKDKLFVSGYSGSDYLKTIDQVERQTSSVYASTLLTWGNATGTIRWNHLFSPKLFANTTFLLTDFKFKLADELKRSYSDGRKTDSYTSYQSAIRDYSLKIDLDYFPHAHHTIKYGGLFTYHQYQPRAFTLTDAVAGENQHTIQQLDNQEFAVYAEDTWQARPNFSVNGGLRASGLHTTDKTYLFAEPRLSLGYRLTSTLQAKASYARMNQFVHLLSNTGAGLSTDLWVPVTKTLRPQQADQFAIGLTKTFPKSGLVLSVDSYRKYLRNIVAYKEGADFLIMGGGVSELKWEDNVTTGRGWSYGTELLIQKNVGRLTGWLGYTLSWTINQFDELNNGKRFFPRQDRRHDLSLVLSYKASNKIRLSANWTYATGNALTVPVGYYLVPQGLPDGSNPTYNIPMEYFGSRNSFRAEPYHRLDLGIQFHKQKRWGERYWEINLFNAYNRRNPFYYYVKTTSGGFAGIIDLKKKSLWPIIPSVSYNFKF